MSIAAIRDVDIATLDPSCASLSRAPTQLTLEDFADLVS
jgi:hypothetical protein